MFRNTKNKTKGLLAAIIALLALALVPSAAQAADGEVNFVRNAKGAFDNYIVSAASSDKSWMHQNYERMRGYPPFFNQALDWAPEAEFYFDLYAIYNDKRGDGLPDKVTMKEHPDWVLRDGDGNPLYIQYDCDGTECTQFAADIGNPEWRQYWIGLAAEHVADGFTGIHIDDVNMEMRVSDGTGEAVAPIDPRTGKEMTLSDWRRYTAEFVEQVRAELNGIEISHNPIWYVETSDPFVQRAYDAADIIELERGFNDEGIVSGDGKYGYETLLAHIDWLHARGKSVIYEPYDLNKKKAIYELAGYFLAKDHDDRIIGDWRVDPHDWWAGWNADLGKAKGERRSWKNVLRRDYTRGMVLVNQPGMDRQVVKLSKRKVKRLRTLDGKRVKRKVALAGGTGRVLIDKRQLG